MNEIVQDLIKTHIELMQACERSTTRLLELALEKDSVNVNHESINRDRLVQTITDYYHRIDELLTDDEINQKTINAAREWTNKFMDWINNLGKMDCKIITALEEQKAETKKDIADVFKTRQKFKGYNLQNVRK